MFSYGQWYIYIFANVPGSLGSCVVHCQNGGQMSVTIILGGTYQSSKTFFVCTREQEFRDTF